MSTDEHFRCAVYHRNYLSIIFFLVSEVSFNDSQVNDDVGLYHPHQSSESIISFGFISAREEGGINAG